MNKLNLQYPYFKDMIDYGLSRDKRAHACWYYAVLAQKNHANVGKGPESQILVTSAHYDDVLWLNKEYERIAKGVAMLYGFGSPDDFMNFKQNVIATARDLPVPIVFADEIWAPPRLLGLNS